MALLLSLVQQQLIKKISANNTGRYDQIAAEVEENELRSMLGIALLQDLQDNPTSTENVKLLDGSSYENYLGQTIKFKGLRYVLAYLNYAKYIGESFVTDTFTGFVAKNRPESELVSEGTMKRLINENRELAMREFDVIKEFLCLNSADYPLWLYAKTQKPHTPRFWGVRKTEKGNDRSIENEEQHYPVPRNT
ncbi:MAG: hypothetical protein M0P71_12090 [Melioribacteraceae bacterium]|jgi:hypothetical protein|nr:hypothetical protein [Melioribacteraceae bacterium]